MTVSALILAAGFSSRLAPRFKPLLALPFAGGELSALARLIRLYQSEGIQPLVISGHCHAQVEAAARIAGATFARNPEPEDGMFSSLRIGVAALPAQCEAFFVQPVDVPLVRPLTIRLLLEVQKKSNAAAFIPAYRGEAGHPPLLRANLRTEISLYDGKDGLRGFLRGKKTELAPVPDGLMLRDMDKPGDYEQIRLLAPQLDALNTAEARELLRLHGVPAKGIAHGEAVGAVARAFAQALGRQKGGIDADLAEAGGLLHDMCKGERNHEQTAGKLLRSLGLERMARLVEDHRDLEIADSEPISERELVFLADKYARGPIPLPLEERFAEKSRLYAHDPQACAAIDGRRARAQALARRLARESGCDPQTLAFAALRQSS